MSNLPPGTSPARLVLIGLCLCALAPMLDRTLAAAEEVTRQDVRSLLDKGAYGEAESAARDLLRSIEAGGGVESLEAADALDLLVESYWRRGIGADARSEAEAQRAIRIKTALLGPDRAEVAFSMTNLANLHYLSWDYDRARPLYEQALAVGRKALGPQAPAVAAGQNNLANLLYDLGDYTGARTLYEGALATRRATLPADDRRVAESLNNLANLFCDIGDFTAARRLYGESLAIFERTLAPLHPHLAVVLHNLAFTCWETGDQEHGLEFCRRALSIREQVLEEDNPDLATTLGLMGSLLREAGDTRRARPLLRRAIEIQAQSNGAEHPSVAIALEDEGVLFLQTREFGAARDDFARSIAIREAFLGPHHPMVGSALRGLAHAALGLGDTTAALEASLRSDRIGCEHLRTCTRGMAEAQALRYAKIRVTGLDLALSVAAGRRLGADQLHAVWDARVRSRAVVLDEMALRHRGAGGRTGARIDSLWAALRGARARLANLMLRDPGYLEPDLHQRLVEETIVERDDLERRIAGVCSGFALKEASREIGLDEVLRALPAGTVLVSYCRYDTGEPYRKGPTSGEGAYVAFAAAAGSQEITVVPLGSAGAIEAAVRSWREAACTPPAWGDAGGGAEERYRAIAAELRRLIWDPLTPALASADRVFVVPDALLHLVNLSALPAAEGGYLVERAPLLHLLSTERDAMAPEHAEVRGLLAVGNPDFAHSEPGWVRSPGPTPAYRGEDRIRVLLAPLPETGIEVRKLSALWRKNRSSEPVVKLLGARAEEGRVKAEMPGKRVVHLATHGFFLGEISAGIPLEPASESNGLAQASRDGEPGSTFAENPLLLSGLVLAGVNGRGEPGPGTEDGVLTAEEVGAMDLRGVEWVVLSSCNTGVGSIRSGEGVLGLRRAFQLAGARTLFLSLWRVPDKATREWMMALYSERLAGRRSTIEAASEATRRVLADRRSRRQSTHPWSWGAFIAAGDWR